MKKNIYRISFFIITLLIILIGHGNSGNLYSDMAIGSRSFSLGQTATVSYSDLLGSMNSPANLILSENYTSSLYYSEPFENSNNFSIGITLPTNGIGTFGFSYFSFLLDNLIESDMYGNMLGSFSYNQEEYVISYGNNLYKRIMFGLNAKWIKDKWSNMSQSDLLYNNLGLDLSLGILPKFESNWLQGLGFGFTMKNILQLNDNDDSIPKELRLIAENSYKTGNHSLLLVMNYLWFEDAVKDFQSTFHVGLEYGYKFAFLRMGYNKNVMSLGIGIQYLFMSLDYGYGAYINNDYSNRSLHNATINIKF